MFIVNDAWRQMSFELNTRRRAEHLAKRLRRHADIGLEIATNVTVQEGGDPAYRVWTTGALLSVYNALMHTTYKFH